MQINRALVIYNKPLYELHILEQEDPHFVRLFKKGHPTTSNWKKVYDSHRRTLDAVLDNLKFLGIQTHSLFRRKLQKIGKEDLVVTVGGDGTFLETSHFISAKQVLLGVNAAPFDSTGALCRGRLDNFLSLMVDLLSGERKPLKLSRLRLKLAGKTLPYAALNEVLFAHKSPAGTSRYLIKVKGKTEEHKSSGVWLATGTGSTAAIRSAGGKTLPITHPGLQFAVRELFPEPAKKLRLVRDILPPRQKLTMVCKMRQAALFIDGNRLTVPVTYGDRVEVSSDGKPLWAVL